MKLDNYECEGQLNLIQQGFARTKCLHNKSYTCNMYWTKQTMLSCDNVYCDKSCCKGCDDKYCGYRCNQSKGE